MPAYFDSSILLSLIRNDAHSERAAHLWNSHPDRVASILLEAECLINTQKLLAKAPEFSISQQTTKQYLGTIKIKTVDQSILTIIQQKPELSQCRTLDALHVATALHFKASSEDPFILITFDNRMAKAAQSVGLEVVGV